MTDIPIKAQIWKSKNERNREITEALKKPTWLFKEFLKESLEIEGIFREPTEEEIEKTWKFLQLPEVKVADLCYLVHVYQPGHVLRTTPQHRFWIGGREAPEGGMKLLQQLGILLEDVTSKQPMFVHKHYEYLHPFTDGNGRSGRALWANLMYKQGYDFRYKFLQMYYYQTLNEYSINKEERS